MMSYASKHHTKKHLIVQSILHLISLPIGKSHYSLNKDIRDFLRVAPLKPSRLLDQTMIYRKSAAVVSGYYRERLSKYGKGGIGFCFPERSVGTCVTGSYQNKLYLFDTYPFSNIDSNIQ